MNRSNGVGQPPVIAAVREPHGARYDIAETWTLCISEKQVLERPDEDVLWVTDVESLADVLHQRTSGSEHHTFVDKTSENVFIKTIPRWLGPLDIKLLSKFLEKHQNVYLPVVDVPGRTTDDRDFQAKERRRTAVKRFIARFQKLPMWENYRTKEEYNRGFCIEYKPGAGIERTERIAQQAEWERRSKREESTRRRELLRTTTSILSKELRLLSAALRHALRSQLPKKVVDAIRPHGSGKAAIIKNIILCNGLLRFVNNPHHQQLASGLRKALKKLIPHIEELKEKAAPFSDLGKYLTEEANLLTKAGYDLET